MFDVLQLLDGHDHSVNFFACFNQLWFLLGRIGEEIITWGRHVFVCLLLVSIGKIVKGCAWRYGNPKQWMPYIQLAVGLFGRTAAEPSWNHHLSFEGWKSFDWRATSMRRNWPSQTSIWSHRRSPLGGLFFGTVFFSAEIFLPDGRESNGSVKEVGGSVSSQGQTDFDTHMITHAQFICCYQLSLYIYTLYLPWLCLTCSKMKKRHDTSLLWTFFRQTTAWQRTCWIFNPRWYVVMDVIGDVSGIEYVVAKKAHH